MGAFIKGKKVYLRAIEEVDITEGSYWSWFNNPDVTQQMMKGAYPNTIDLQKQYYTNVIQDPANLILAIVDAESNRHIGTAGLHHISAIHRNAEMGIIVGEKEYWGKGYGTEAIRLICKHGFDFLNLHRIELGVFAEHESAIKSYEKVGFKFEGVKKEHAYKHGKYQDVVIMGMLREDLKF